MGNDTLTLVLTGEVTLLEFTQAVHDFQELVDALQDEAAHGKHIAWMIAGLEAGSATLVSRGIPETDSTADDVSSVVRAYEDTGRAVESGQLDRLSPRVRTHIRALTGLINGHIDSVRFETNEWDGEINEPMVTQQAQPRIGGAVIHGAVRGRIQMVSSRGQLRFTLYDALKDHAVSCYIQEGGEELLRGAWGKLAIVQGVVRRNVNTGQPISIRNVSDIRVLEQHDKWAWREAIGCAPRRPGEPSAVEAIRMARDAEA